MKRAALCGTFDPVTLGHLDLIERASEMFDEVVVFISCNSNKNNMFSEEHRLKWLKQSVSHLDNVSCAIQDGLVIDACHAVHANVLVRGIRNTVDFEYEKNMAYMNQKIDRDIDTVCLFTRPELSLCSSSNVREFLKYGLDISCFVPSCVSRDLMEEEK